MSALMLIQCRITNVEKFMAYGKATPAVVEQYGGRYIAMRGATELLEGDWDEQTKVVISEWPSMEAARTFWHSSEYREAKKLREGAAEVQVLLVEKTAE